MFTRIRICIIARKCAPRSRRVNSITVRLREKVPLIFHLFVRYPNLINVHV